MARSFKVIFAAITLVLSFVAPVAAEPGLYEDAVNALNAGDQATAHRRFLALAELGDLHPQFLVGFMYRMGWGVPQDYAEALNWLRKAANRGHAKAQSNLAFMYRDAEGVRQDYVQAHMWFNLSSVASGKLDDMIAGYRDELAKKMSPAQIAEAQKLAREWKPTTQTTR